MKDEQNVEKLIQLVKKICSYCATVSEEDFVNNEILVEACVFNLTQLGETAHKISDDFIKQHPEIAWNELYGLRNRLVHDYQGVNLNLVWEIIKGDLPILEQQLEALI